MDNNSNYNFNEQNNIQKSDKKLIMIITILAILVVGLTGFIVYDKVLTVKIEEKEDSKNNSSLNEESKEEKNESKDEKNESKEEKNEIKEEPTPAIEKRDLTEIEKNTIQQYINRQEINPLVQMNYTEPKNLLNSDNNYYMFEYSINASNYIKAASDAEVDTFWDGNPRAALRVVTVNDVIDFIESITGYKFTENEIKTQIGSQLHPSINKFTIIITDSTHEEYQVTSGRIDGDKYYVTLNNGTTVTLTKSNDQYRLYACQLK